jgi:transcription initiation factor IIE alpha subunit
MAKVIGFDEKVYKRFTCYHCGAIVQYAPNEDKFTDKTDEGTKIKGLDCPNCNEFHRTNP